MHEGQQYFKNFFTFFYKSACRKIFVCYNHDFSCILTAHSVYANELQSNIQSIKHSAPIANTYYNHIYEPTCKFSNKRC